MQSLAGGCRKLLNQPPLIVGQPGRDLDFDGDNLLAALAVSRVHVRQALAAQPKCRAGLGAFGNGDFFDTAKHRHFKCVPERCLLPGGQRPGEDKPSGRESLPPDRQPQAVHGPFEGWTPAAVALGADEAAHVLWRFDGGGLASMWRMMGSEEVTHAEYGPFAGWVPVALALGP